MSFLTSLLVGLVIVTVFAQSAVTVGCTYWVVSVLKTSRLE